MMTYDLCLAWEWNYDTDFVQLLGAACQGLDISFLQITPENLDGTLEALLRNEISFWAFLDRASDTDKRFYALAPWANKSSVYCINPIGFARQAWNKAKSQQTFTEAGIPTPPTIILPSYSELPNPDPPDLSMLGLCFSIKPAFGGGGKGVIKQAYTWDQVLIARKEYPLDQYLLQSYINPAVYESHPAWFRVLYCLGEIFPCWWNPDTHVYKPLSYQEEERFALQRLRLITAQIAQLSKLDLFSTEIAFPSDGNCYVIDHVNDPIDLRLQSKAFEGVPDELVVSMTNHIARVVAQKIAGR